MATYDLTSSIPTVDSLKSGDILNCPYSASVKTITLPMGIYKLECWGAQGGTRSASTYGGKGGYSVGTLSLSEETNIYIRVGGSGNTGQTSGGFNGGGKRKNYNGGGGASDIRIGQDSLYARVIVAGGGGSEGGSNKKGGYGGGDRGGEAVDGYGTGGFYGTQTGVSDSSWQLSEQSTSVTNQSGAFAGFGFGGNGIYVNDGYGGAGGGGWYGGCGAYPDNSGDDDRGGGGGSGYVYTSSTATNYPSGCLLTSKYYLTDAQTIAGNASFPATTTGTETGHSGNGYVRITVLKLPSSFSMPVKVGYKWYNSDKIYVKVNDTWEVCTKAYVKINGAWKELINNTIVNTYTLSKTGNYVGTVTVNGAATTLQAQVEPGATVIVKSTPYNSNLYTMTFKHTGTSFTISSNSATTGNGAVRTVKFTMPKGNVSVSFTRTAIATGTYTITKGNNVSSITINGLTPIGASTANAGDTIVVTSSNFNPSNGNMSFSCSTNVTTTESISGSGSASRKVVTFKMPASNITVSFTKGSGSIM